MKSPRSDGRYLRRILSDSSGWSSRLVVMLFLQKSKCHVVSRCGVAFSHSIQAGHHDNWHSKVVQFQKGFGFIQPDDGGIDAFVHVSAVERAGMSDLREGQKISFDLRKDARTGKMSAANLQTV